MHYFITADAIFWKNHKEFIDICSQLGILVIRSAFILGRNVLLRAEREGAHMPRPQKKRCICSLPRGGGFVPKGCEVSGSINLTYDEYEVIRLLDLMQMTQEQCALRRGISRPTVTRIYDEARRKMADMLVNVRELTISGGDVYVCPAMRPECEGEEHCCHKNPGLERGWLKAHSDDH